MSPRLVKIVRGVVRPLPVPMIGILLLAASALLGNVAQFQDRGRAESQIAELKAAGADDTGQAECRSRIVGYVDGLSIQHDIALGTGLLDRVGPQDDDAFADALAAYADSVAGLEVAKDYRENAVEVCAADPGFDPSTDIPSS